jgi:PAS domain S-box-containing protein
MAGFSLNRLVIEITESALTESVQASADICRELKTMGCKIALDDFGTGYSSLLHLQSLPFDELKIDRSFVSSMQEQRQSRKIVSAVVGLGQSLGLTTIAEGIETQEQAEMLLWLGCELGQGWLYGKPVPATELAKTILTCQQRMPLKLSPHWQNGFAGTTDASPTQRMAQLQAVYDGAPVGLGFLDCDLRYVNLNKRLAEMNGATVEDHLGALVEDMVPEIFHNAETYLHRALEGEAIADVEATVPATASSAEETRLVSYQPARDEAGEVVGVSIAVIDITERKKIEEALQESEEHYRNMVELNPQVLWVMDPKGHNLEMTPTLQKSKGAAPKHPMSPCWLDSVHPDDFQPTVDAIASFMYREVPLSVDYRTRVKTGGWRWMRSCGSPRFDSDGKIVCWYGSVEDIDELKQTTLALHATEAKLEALKKNDSVGPLPKGIPAVLVKGTPRHRALTHRINLHS